MSSQAAYEKLTRQDVEDADVYSSVKWKSSREKRRGTFVWISLLILSNAFTWWIARGVPIALFAHKLPERSPYAKVANSYQIEYEHGNAYTSSNDTVARAAWGALSADNGVVALSKKYIEENSLPPSQPFPWDTNKQVYLLSGYHALHCVRSVYFSLMEFTDNVPQSRPLGHMVHCLDAIRQDILCHADDTPRWSDTSHVASSGVGQARQCRSWNKLDQWAREHTSCFRYVNETATPEELPQIQRFLYCPKDSPYRTEVEKVFGNIYVDDTYD